MKEKSHSADKSLKNKKGGCKLNACADSNGVQAPEHVGKLTNWYFKYLLTQNICKNTDEIIPYPVEPHTQSSIGVRKLVKMVNFCRKIIYTTSLLSACTCCKIYERHGRSKDSK
jgi:hypothetical protein